MGVEDRRLNQNWSRNRDSNPDRFLTKELGYHYIIPALEQNARIERALPLYEGGVMPLDQSCFVNFHLLSTNLS